EEVDVPKQAIKAKAADMSIFYVVANKDAKVSLTGPADPSYLTAGMFVQFTANSTKQGVVKDDIKDLVICEVDNNVTPAFGPDDPIAAAAAKDNKDAVIKYFIRGQVK